MIWVINVLQSKNLFSPPTLSEWNNCKNLSPKSPVRPSQNTCIYLIFKKNIKHTFNSIYFINYYKKLNNLPNHHLVLSIRNCRNIRDGCTKISVRTSVTILLMEIFCILWKFKSVNSQLYFHFIISILLMIIFGIYSTYLNDIFRWYL